MGKTVSTRDIVDMLRTHGLKPTPQRVEILRKIQELGYKHPSLNEIYREARKRILTLSFSALYMTVKKLEDRNIIKLFDILGETRIEVNVKPHFNIVYLRENTIVDYEDEELIRILMEKTGLGDRKNILVNILVYE